jgi:hypothetical protein
MNNSLVISTFLKQLDECIADISLAYSTDERFIKCKRYLDGMKKSNPGVLIKTWKKLITDKYETQINSGDIDYFLEKDFTKEASEFTTPSMIDTTIQDLRQIIRDMSDENKKITFKYIQNLCKLSNLYV